MQTQYLKTQDLYSSRYIRSNIMCQYGSRLAESEYVDLEGEIVYRRPHPPRNEPQVPKNQLLYSNPLIDSDRAEEQDVADQMKSSRAAYEKRYGKLQQPINCMTKQQKQEFEALKKSMTTEVQLIQRELRECERRGIKPEQLSKERQIKSAFRALSVGKVYNQREADDTRCTETEEFKPSFNLQIRRNLNNEELFAQKNKFHALNKRGALTAKVESAKIIAQQNKFASNVFTQNELIEKTVHFGTLGESRVCALNMFVSRKKGPMYHTDQKLERAVSRLRQAAGMYE